MTCLRTALALLVAIALTYDAPERARYLMVGELVTNLEANAGRDSKVHGYIKAGSVVHVAADRHHFVLFDRGAAITVAATGDWSEVLRDEAEVIVYGRLAGTALVGTAINAKCPTGKYEGVTDPDVAARFRDQAGT